MTAEDASFLKNRWLRPVIGTFVGGIALYFALRQMDFTLAWRAMGKLSLPWLAAAVVISFLTHVLKALRWRMLLKAHDARYPFLRILSYLLAGQLVNIFIPGRAGDIGRAVVLGNQGAGKVFSLGTVVMEKVLDIVFYAALAILLISRIAVPDQIQIRPEYLLLFLLVPIITLGLLGLKWPWVSHRMIDWKFPRGDKRREAFHSAIKSMGRVLDVLSDPARFLYVMMFSALAWLSGWLTNEIVLNAFDLDFSLFVSLMLLIVLQAGISVNLVPGTLGVFEYLCVLVLGRFSVSMETAIAYGVVLHLVVLLPLVAGGIAAWWLPPFKLERTTV